MFTFNEIKEKSIPIAERYGVDALYLFGSYSRNEQNDKSDIDFLMIDGEIDSLLKYSEFYQALEDTFGCHVDVVSSGINNREFLNNIQKDAKELYVRKR